MKLRFTKMQGAGNDFVVVDGFTSPILLAPQQIKTIANRYFGVGCDQLLVVEKTNTPNVDFRYRIFNADGGEVEHCGNGARCFVRFVVDKGLTTKHEITVETVNNLLSLKLENNGQVTVNMGAPRFNPVEIPFVAETRQNQYPIQLASESINIAAVSMGNPHAVTLVDDVETAKVMLQGSQIEAHVRFPQRVNVGFMQVISQHEIKLRVYERGSGETLSCGTGACAAVVSGIQCGALKSPVKVSTRGGELQIVWAGEGSSVMMTGPAEIVFEGEITL